MLRIVGCTKLYHVCTMLQSIYNFLKISSLLIFSEKEIDMYLSPSTASTLDCHHRDTSKSSTSLY